LIQWAIGLSFYKPRHTHNMAITTFDFWNGIYTAVSQEIRSTYWAEHVKQDCFGHSGHPLIQGHSTEWPNSWEKLHRYSVYYALLWKYEMIHICGLQDVRIKYFFCYQSMIQVIFSPKTVQNDSSTHQFCPLFSLDLKFKCPRLNV
jgi:hypothetical protein